jgi:putative tryptophan/tyrosine transport system substrate-binding protein
MSGATRRHFIAGLGAAVAAPPGWPLAARAQQSECLRRIGVLMGWAEVDPQPKAWLSVFTQRLSDLGWADGRNMRLDIRWAGGSIERARAHAKELVALQPDVILAASTAATAALQRETQKIPIVFIFVADPVGEGFIASLARPGGNITGFMGQEATMAGKWLELLTEIAPAIKRAALMFNPATAPYGRSHYLPLFEAAAQSLKVEPIVAPVNSDADIDMIISSLGRAPRGGLVVPSDAFVLGHRAQVIAAAARDKVPAVYDATIYVRDGGLLSYGIDFFDQFGRAAPYVDRILHGEAPAQLPVQLPVKFDMAASSKTAKSLDLTVPPSILLRADEVIE